jgi:hypothetical protein
VGYSAAPGVWAASHFVSANSTPHQLGKWLALSDRYSSPSPSLWRQTPARAVASPKLKSNSAWSTCWTTVTALYQSYSYFLTLSFKWMIPVSNTILWLTTNSQDGTTDPHCQMKCLRFRTVSESYRSSGWDQHRHPWGLSQSLLWLQLTLLTPGHCPAPFTTPLTWWGGLLPWLRSKPGARARSGALHTANSRVDGCSELGRKFPVWSIGPWIPSLGCVPRHKILNLEAFLGTKMFTAALS